MHFPKNRGVQSFLASFFSIALGNHVKTHMAGAYSDKPTMHTAGYHVDLSQTAQECAGLNPQFLQSKNLFKTANCSAAL